jgi:diaminopropionate ammonia-lyase
MDHHPATSLPIDRAAMTWTPNQARDHGWTCPPVSAEVRDFHRTLPGYAPTTLADLPGLARDLGVAHVLAKDESNRLGLPAFKGLGASWAIHRALRDRIDSGASDGPVTIVTATDGNHGRAVARFARQLGRRAHIFVPDGVHPAAVQAIRDEGATVAHVPGTYDDAVHTAAAHTGRLDDGVLVQDTAWDGYEDVPGWIVDGYSTLFAELDDQLRDRGITRPDLVVVPTGVGSLLQAALARYRSDPDLLGTAVVSVEPVDAACVLASVTAGRPVAVDTGRTVMAGLNCGTVSTLAWPYITHGLDACLTVTDAQAADAARDLAALGIPAGPCGAAPLAAVRTINATKDASESDRRRSLLGLSPTATIVLLVTEGAAANPGLAPSNDPSSPRRARS